MSHTLEWDEEAKDLRLTHLDDEGRPQEAHLDMVVLATGFCPAPDAVAQAKALGIDLDTYRFADTEYFKPVSTSRPGVYACGMALGPQDIPGSLIQASAATLFGQRPSGPRPLPQTGPRSGQGNRG